MVLGYARVSKGQDQDTRLQETVLRAAGVERLFTEQASGGRWDRPQLHRLLDHLRPRDVVVVWQLDRLSRSLKDLALSVPEAAPLVRLLLRVAGRVIIDTGEPSASPDVWPNTREMALQWIDEALRSLGYQVRPTPDSGRSELKRPEETW